MKILTHGMIDVITLSKEQCRHPIQGKLVYAATDNFLGRRVAGYHPAADSLCLMTARSAEALCAVQNQLAESGIGLFIFDSYRPLRAVHDFHQWMQQPPESPYELERKKIHYPHIEKSQLATLGYLAADVSNHCYGDTVDLSLIDLQNNTLLDMGACFDYFDEISHTTATVDRIGETAFRHREILTQTMLNTGFLPYEKEFWHFTFQQRDIPEPMDFEITHIK